MREPDMPERFDLGPNAPHRGLAAQCSPEPQRLRATASRTPTIVAIGGRNTGVPKKPATQ